MCLDNCDNFLPTNEHKFLPVANPFEMTFRERFRLSKKVMKCFINEVNVKLHLFVQELSYCKQIARELQT